MRILLPVLLLGLTLGLPVHAGDVLWRITHGDQDFVGVIQIQSIDEERMTANVLFTFPQTKVNPRSVSIIIKPFAEGYSDFPTVGESYLASLNRSGRAFVPRWGLRPIINATSTCAQINPIRFGDDAAFTMFIRTRGKATEFSGVGETLSMHTASGTSVEIYPSQTVLRSCGDISATEAVAIQAKELIPPFRRAIQLLFRIVANWFGH
ncbi:MAG: hypothetical protein Q7R83_01030 [bacterium]|nr:hypothetical protein [bacterium]